MITYAERVCFQPGHVRLLTRVDALVAGVSRLWGNELRCHELARAVHCVVADPSIMIVDGRCGSVEHSWLQFPDAVILDAYAPGRLPAVQLVDPLIGFAYRSGLGRDDIRQSIVDRLVIEMRHGTVHQQIVALDR